MMKCGKCGQLTEDDSIFCGNCGAKVEAPKVEALKVEVPKVEAPKMSASTGKEKRASTGLIMLGIVSTLMVLAAMATVGYLLLFDTENTPVESDAADANADVNADAVAAPRLSALTDAAAKLSPFDDEEVKVHIQKVNDISLVKNIDARANLFEFSRSDNKKNFDFHSTLKIPYDADEIDSGENPGDCVVAAYYNPKTSRWAPVMFKLDTVNKAVLISTNHFSVFAAFTFKNKGKRMANVELPASINTGRLPKVDYKKIIHEVSEGNETSALEAGFNVVNNPFNFAGNGLTLATEPLRIVEPLSKWPRVDKIGSAALGIGVALAAVQLILDYQDEGEVGAKTLLNALKNTTYLAISRFGSSALKVKAVGFFIIDYSLNSFASEAWDNLEDKHRNIYKNYYKRRYGSEAGEQRYLLKKIYSAYQKSVNQKKKFDLGNEIRLTMLNHCGEFWKQSVLESVDEMSQASDTWFSNLVPKQQQEISDGYCYNLMESSGKAIIENMVQRIRMDLESEYMKELNRLQRELNAKVVVTIYEPHEDDDKPYQYANHLARFAPLNEQAVVTNWQGRLPDDVTIRVPFQLAGFLTAGAPKKIQVFAPNDDPDEDEPVLEVPFTLNRNNIKVALVSQKAELAGTYRSVVPSRKMILAELAKLGFIDGAATDAPVTMVVGEDRQMRVTYQYKYSYRKSEEDEFRDSGSSEADFTVPVKEDGTFYLDRDGDYFKGKIHMEDGKMVADVEMTESSMDETIRKVVRFTAQKQE